MLRRFMTVAMGLGALGTLIVRADAAELEGFGSIKFGMSKEEAWAAIDGKGEWSKQEDLMYEFPSEDSVAKFTVKQKFEEKRASDVFVEYALKAGSPEYCLARGLYFAAVIEEKHGVSPLFRYGSAEPAKPWKKDSRDYIVQDVYAFSFDDNASIQMVARYGFEEPECLIVIRYTPPNQYENPF